MGRKCECLLIESQVPLGFQEVFFSIDIYTSFLWHVENLPPKIGVLNEKRYFYTIDRSVGFTLRSHTDRKTQFYPTVNVLNRPQGRSWLKYHGQIKIRTFFDGVQQHIIDTR